MEITFYIASAWENKNKQKTGEAENTENVISTLELFLLIW